MFVLYKDFCQLELFAGENTYIYACGLLECLIMGTLLKKKELKCGQKDDKVITLHTCFINRPLHSLLL